MASSRSIGALASLPIAPLEFYHALTGLWATWQGAKHVPLQRIGLAVSGGSDSMALVYLCSQLASQGFIPGLDIKAYIVDHKYRPESSHEAHSVADCVEKLGVRSKVLTLQWPDGEALTKKGFETQARMLRYQILGKACTKDGVKALLLGHHQDDNVETALMRVSKGHRKLGLVGFDEIAPIPECHGLYGVSKSGSATSLQDILRSATMDGTISYPSSEIPPRSFNSNTGEMKVSTGGIYLFRPFRSFSKSRLVATCQENNIPFVSDATNEDHTFTIRNTVRRLLESETLLPRALQRPSILSLVDKSREQTEKFRELCEFLLKNVEILNFDTRFGTMVIKMPRISDLPRHQRKAVYERISLPDGIRDVYASVLRSLCDIISPYPDRWSPLSQFRNPACRAFFGSDPSGMNGTVFTVGGVLWQAVKQKTAPESTSKSFVPSHPNLPGDLQLWNQDFTPFADKQNNVWLLSRQPMRSGKGQSTVNFSLTIPAYSAKRTRDGVILGKVGQKGREQGTGNFIHTAWTDWKLWDNRYWIRIRGRASVQQYDRSQEDPESGGAMKRSLDRDMSKDDFVKDGGREPRTQSRRASQDSTLANYLASRNPLPTTTTLPTMPASVLPVAPSVFQKLLAALAPGKIRFSAPILTDVIPENGGGEDLENMQEQLLGMPSVPMSFRTKIRVRTPISDVESGRVDSTFDVPWSVEWEVRYKWIDPTTIRTVAWQST
ncbi:PP-loop family protein [Nannizzia gypsea CBS 118893]|uniref:tRNA(Ile)-lysidine synthetase n=1 Tax=Arthroderma gypseum (strain ATCC MYA-4604 / CBS 118893) TaxID=535722 RepID=E4UYM9_ARTGP|nr:PP-loop family protein [Nannizzia gypsea CBS 118893]EFR03209.1 PP-loop family protein [Nannizzia gypsea CBS 118893]